MTIYEWMDVNSVTIRRTGVPPILARKFDLTDDVDFYANQNEDCWSGLCKNTNLFAAYRVGKGIRGSKIDQPDPELRGW